MTPGAGTHQAPPERICVGIEVVILPLLCQVHQERGQDEAQEAYVPGGDQLLEETPRLSAGQRAAQPAPRSSEGPAAWP